MSEFVAGPNRFACVIPNHVPGQHRLSRAMESRWPAAFRIAVSGDRIVNEAWASRIPYDHAGSGIPVKSIRSEDTPVDSPRHSTAALWHW